MRKTFGTAYASNSPKTKRQIKEETGARIRRAFSIEDQLNALRSAIITGNTAELEAMHKAIEGVRSKERKKRRKANR